MEALAHCAILFVLLAQKQEPAPSANWDSIGRWTKPPQPAIARLTMSSTQHPTSAWAASTAVLSVWLASIPSARVVTVPPTELSTLTTNSASVPSATTMTASTLSASSATIPVKVVWVLRLIALPVLLAVKGFIIVGQERAFALNISSIKCQSSWKHQLVPPVPITAHPAAIRPVAIHAMPQTTDNLTIWALHAFVRSVSSMMAPKNNYVEPAPTPATPAQIPPNAPNVVLPTSGPNLLICAPASPGTMTLNWTSPPVMPVITPVKHAPTARNAPVARSTTLESKMMSANYASAWEGSSIQARNSVLHADTHAWLVYPTLSIVWPAILLPWDNTITVPIHAIALKGTMTRPSNCAPLASTPAKLVEMSGPASHVMPQTSGSMIGPVASASAAPITTTTQKMRKNANDAIWPVSPAPMPQLVSLVMPPGRESRMLLQITPASVILTALVSTVTTVWAKTKTALLVTILAQPVAETRETTASTATQTPKELSRARNVYAIKTTTMTM